MAAVAYVISGHSSGCPHCGPHKASTARAQVDPATASSASSCRQVCICRSCVPTACGCVAPRSLFRTSRICAAGKAQAERGAPSAGPSHPASKPSRRAPAGISPASNARGIARSVRARHGVAGDRSSLNLGLEVPPLTTGERLRLRSSSLAAAPRQPRNVTSTPATLRGESFFMKPKSRSAPETIVAADL